MNDGITDSWTISNGKYKLLVNATGDKKMYNLTTDPYESTDLLTGALTTTESTAKTKLETELFTIRK